MWQTTFAFQTWSSAIEFRRYLRRFIQDFKRINTLECMVRTPFNQYDSLVMPLMKVLKEKGVQFQYGTTVTDVDVDTKNSKLTAKKIFFVKDQKQGEIAFDQNDLVIIQNGSMTDASSIGKHN